MSQQSDPTVLQRVIFTNAWSSMEGRSHAAEFISAMMTVNFGLPDVSINKIVGANIDASEKKQIAMILKAASIDIANKEDQLRKIINLLKNFKTNLDINRTIIMEENLFISMLIKEVEERKDLLEKAIKHEKENESSYFQYVVTDILKTINPQNLFKNILQTYSDEFNQALNNFKEIDTLNANMNNLLNNMSSKIKETISFINEFQNIIGHDDYTDSFLLSLHDIEDSISTAEIHLNNIQKSEEKLLKKLQDNQKEMGLILEKNPSERTEKDIKRIMELTQQIAYLKDISASLKQEKQLIINDITPIFVTLEKLKEEYEDILLKYQELGHKNYTSDDLEKIQSLTKDMEECSEKFIISTRRLEDLDSQLEATNKTINLKESKISNKQDEPETLRMFKSVKSQTGFGDIVNNPENKPDEPSNTNPRLS